MSTNLHAHFSSRVVDCDGPLDRDWVDTITERDRKRAEAERREDTTDEEFAKILERVYRDRVALSLISTQPMHQGRLTVTSFEDGTSRLEWSEATEEGYIAMDALFCVDEGCDPNARGQRDHFAEAAGY